MQVELCLVLDTFGYHRLVLKKGSSYEIDEYTSKNFENSNQIREKYEKEIYNFLSSYKNKLEQSDNPNYNGRIAIVIPSKIGEDINFYQRKVIYKKHIITFNEAIKNKDLMVSFSLYERKKSHYSKSLVTDYFHHMIRMPWNNKSLIKTYINGWIKEEKEKKIDYYEIVRDMLIVYENERKYKKNLLSFDERYELYKKEKLLKKLSKNNFKLEKNTNHVALEKHFEEEKFFNVNGNKYTIDELHLLDIEDIDLESDYIPDVLGGKSR